MKIPFKWQTSVGRKMIADFRSFCNNFLNEHVGAKQESNLNRRKQMAKKSTAISITPSKTGGVA